MKKTLLLAVALMCSAAIAHSQVLLDVDFLNDTPGQAPSSATSIANPDQGRIFVVDANSDPADPFGGAGNRSLLVEKTKSGAVPTVRWGFSEISHGEVSADIYAPINSDGFTSTGVLYLYNNEKMALGIIWSGNGKLSVMTRSDDNSSDVVIPLVSTILFDETTTVHVAFSESTFTLSINGQLQESAAGQTEFLLRGNLSTVNNIRFAQASTTTVNSRFFLNSFEVKAIPEPSSAAMLGVLGLGGFLSLKMFRPRASGRE